MDIIISQSSWETCFEINQGGGKVELPMVLVSYTEPRAQHYSQVKLITKVWTFGQRVLLRMANWSNRKCQQHQPSWFVRIPLAILQVKLILTIIT